MFESVWLKILPSLKLEIHLVFTTTPPITSFCKIYWLKEVDVCQKTISEFIQTSFILRRNTIKVFGRNWRRQFSYHQVFDYSQSQHRLVRVSRGCNKKSFAIKLFQFYDIKTHQLYILRDPFLIVESVEPGCLFSSFFMLQEQVKTT